MAKSAPAANLVLTAQDLRSGAVVYWQGEHWAADIAEALTSDDAASMQAMAAAANAGNDVLDAFVFSIADIDSARRPTRYREAQRLVGPSIAYGRDAAA